MAVVGDGCGPGEKAKGTVLHAKQWDRIGKRDSDLAGAVVRGSNYLKGAEDC